MISVLLFGSKARGDFKEESDTDIFVLLKNKRNKVNDNIAEITAGVLDDYGILHSPVSYDVEEAEMNVRMHSFFFDAVEREGIPI